jgi:hypothetical protein
VQELNKQQVDLETELNNFIEELRKEYNAGEAKLYPGEVQCVDCGAIFPMIDPPTCSQCGLRKMAGDFINQLLILVRKRIKSIEE